MKQQKILCHVANCIICNRRFNINLANTNTADQFELDNKNYRKNVLSGDSPLRYFFDTFKKLQSYFAQTLTYYKGYTFFETTGHYGSTIVDGDKQLVIVFCDSCLKKKMKDKRTVHQFTTMFKEWQRY